jgi:hypothetical protein
MILRDFEANSGQNEARYKQKARSLVYWFDHGALRDWVFVEHKRQNAAVADVENTSWRHRKVKYSQELHLLFQRIGCRKAPGYSVVPYDVIARRLGK